MHFNLIVPLLIAFSLTHASTSRYDESDEEAAHDDHLRGKRVFLENKREADKRVFLENKREPEKRVFLENKRVFLENKRDDWGEESHLHRQPHIASEHSYGAQQLASSEEEALDEFGHTLHKRVFLENKRNPEKRVFLENKRVFLENKREPEKRVFLENKRVFLENKREAEKRVFLENKRGGLHNTHHHVFDEQPTHLRGFKDEHTAIQHDVSEELRS